MLARPESLDQYIIIKKKKKKQNKKHAHRHFPKKRKFIIQRFSNFLTVDCRSIAPDLMSSITLATDGKVRIFRCSHC